MTTNHSVFSELVAKGYTISASQKPIVNGKRIYFLTAKLDFDAVDLLTTFRRNGLPVADFKVEQRGNGVHQNYQIKVTVTT